MSLIAPLIGIIGFGLSHGINPSHGWPVAVLYAMRTRQVISSAMEYVWLMADQALITGPLISQAVGTRDLFIRIMIPKSSHIPQRYQNIKTLLGNKLELTLLPDENAKVAIAMNEKISGITFSDLKGKIDFDCGFTIIHIIYNSSDFHKWCNNLFTFYWDRSKKPFFISS